MNEDYFHGQIEKIRKFKLKNIFNIQPRIYLPFCLMSLILWILLGHFFFTPVTVIELDSNLSFSSVYIDGVWSGYTPLKKKISHDKPINIEIKRELFFTLNKAINPQYTWLAGFFFPRKIQWEASLQPISLNSYTEMMYQKLAKWLPLRSHQTDTYFIPPVIEDFHYLLNQHERQNEKENILKTVAPYWGNFNRFYESIHTLDKNTSIDPILMQSPQEWWDLWDKLFPTSIYPLSFFWFFTFDDQNMSFPWMNEEWFIQTYQNKMNEQKQWIQKSFDEEKKVHITQSSFYLRQTAWQWVGVPANMSFDWVKASLQKGSQHSVWYVKQVNPFHLVRSFVSQKEFAQFIQDNPQWAKTNINFLIEKSWVDDNYLFDFDSLSSQPVTFVSYIAIQAFIQWKNENSSYEYRLPSEAELELYYRYASEEQEYWEWTKTEYLESQGKLEAIERESYRVEVYKVIKQGKQASELVYPRAPYATWMTSPFTQFRLIRY